jgi:hypothetical protein
MKNMAKWIRDHPNASRKELENEWNMRWIKWYLKACTGN